MNKEISQLKKLVNYLLSKQEIPHGLGRALRNLNKEITAFESVSQSSAKHSIKGKVGKVQIGGGKHTLDGYLNIDIFEPADLVCDLREGIPLENESVEFIFTEHFFEHIDYPTSAKRFIQECYRILEEDSQIVLGVPDAEQVLKGYQDKDKALREEYIKRWYANRNCKGDFNTYIDLVNYVFRDQDDDEKYNPHFWAYDFEKLSDLFTSAGFSSVSRWNFDPLIANPKREFGSIYVIATK